MIRGVVKDGLIEPLEPLPAAWNDGREVEVREVDEDRALSDEELDEWLRRGNELAAQIDPNDLKRMVATIDEADAIAKEQVCREMGL